MKLLKLPEIETDYIDTVAFGGQPVRMAGRTTVSNVMISAPHKEEEIDEVWNKLKYGTQPDLAEAMLRHEKIDKIEFAEDGFILYGVLPIKRERSSIWSGQLFECTVDFYEEI